MVLHHPSARLSLDNEDEDEYIEGKIINITFLCC